MKVASKNVYWKKQQSIPNTCTILPLKKTFYQNLTDAFFKNLYVSYSKYILYMVLCSFDFYLNYVTPPPPPKKKITQYSTHTEIKISDHPPKQRLFWNFSPLQAGGGQGGGGALFTWPPVKIQSLFVGSLYSKPLVRRFLNLLKMFGKIHHYM